MKTKLIIVKISLSLLLLIPAAKVSLCQTIGFEIDSLNNILKTQKEDTERVNILNSVAKKYWLWGYCDKSISNGNEALRLAEKLHFRKGIADSYNNLGVANMDAANYSEAIKNYLVALEIRKEIGNKGDIIHSYTNIGNVYVNQGNYPEALKNYFSALTVAEEINEKGAIANSFEGIGNVYLNQGNYPEALKNYTESLNIREELKDKHGMSFSYVNLGNLYTKQGNYIEALKNYFATLELEKEMQDYRTILVTYGNIGNVYAKQGKYADALKNYLVALKMEEQMKDKYGMADSYINIGTIYFNMRKNTVAKVYLEKGLHLCKESGTIDEIKDSYYVLAKIDSARGNFKGAYQYHLLYSIMKDSILNERSNKQINQLKIQYETDKKDQQINTQSLQLKTRDLQLQNQVLHSRILGTRIYYSMAVSVIAISIILLLFYLRNKRKKKEYEHMLTDLELTALKSQLNPHFIFNALMSIELYIDANPQAGANYLNRFSQLMRGVLESSEEKEISLAGEMKLMKHYIELEKLRLSDKLNYSITYDSLIDADKIMIPSLITQPIIENAIWHGSTPADRKRELNLHSALSGNKLVIRIYNNALKAATNNQVSANKRKSFGVKITRERLALLKQTEGEEGKLDIEILPDQTIVEITIPLKRNLK